MRHLLKNLFGILVLIFSIEISAQDILNLSLEPSSPEEGDSVHMIVDLQFSNSQCGFLGTQLSVSPDSIFIKICHFEGLFPAICNISDTILIGADMSAGDYTIELISKNTGSMVDLVCNVANSESDTAYHSFTVSEKSVGIADIRNAEVKWNSLVYDYLYIEKQKNQKCSLKIYSTSGQFLQEHQIVGEINKIDLSFLSSGVYLLKIYPESGFSKSGIISVIN
ncbi:MAG: T9SS type A sorting domain-containing protein [Chitinophagales bacterium]|nr:T9SS type A sorting domain-containing protein [Chitinophagales bacterium]